MSLKQNAKIDRSGYCISSLRGRSLYAFEWPRAGGGPVEAGNFSESV